MDNSPLVQIRGAGFVNAASASAFWNLAVTVSTNLPVLSKIQVTVLHQLVECIVLDVDFRIAIRPMTVATSAAASTMSFCPNE